MCVESAVEAKPIDLRDRSPYLLMRIIKMRQIKFRVWSESRKKWLNECMFDMEIKGAYDFSSDSSMRYNYKTDVIVEQFTGAEDSCGNDIYDGDIVSGFFLGVVQWSEEDCFFWVMNVNNRSGGMLNQAYMKNFKVIGNIHQNPELLEQNDEHNQS